MEGRQDLFTPSEEERTSPQMTEAPPPPATDSLLKAAIELEQARAEDKRIRQEWAAHAHDTRDLYANHSVEERAASRVAHAKLAPEVQDAHIDLQNAIKRWGEACAEILGYELNPSFRIWSD